MLMVPLSYMEWRSETKPGVEIGDKAQSPPKVRTATENPLCIKPGPQEVIRWCQGELEPNHPTLYSLGTTRQIAYTKPWQ